jgi:hypothetical protein
LIEGDIIYLEILFARDAVSMPPKAMCVALRLLLAVTGLRADGIILLADEDCSKILLVDGCDPTLVSLLLTSPRRTLSIYLLSTPTAPLSYPLDSQSLALLARNSVLCSTDSLEPFSNKSKIFADPFPASGSTI